MRRRLSLLAVTFTSLAATSALAGETKCWVDNGAVIVSAALGDITGDFILDLSAPRSQLHLTRAQGDGIDAPTVPDDPAQLTLAGEHIPADFAIADLDAASWGFPTTINGIIGWDVMAGYVVDLQLSPCRLSLSRAAAPLAGAQRMPLAIVGGAPTVTATVSDGRTALSGPFAFDTGSAGVRLADTTAALAHAAPKGVDPLSRAEPPARLAALSLGDVVMTRLPASLETQTPAGLSGSLGLVVWSRYAVRLDARRGILELSTPAP